MTQPPDHRRDPARPVQLIARELADSSGYLLARLGLAFKAQALASAEAVRLRALRLHRARDPRRGRPRDAGDDRRRARPRPEPARRAARLTRGARPGRAPARPPGPPPPRRQHHRQRPPRARAAARDRQQGRGRLLRAARRTRAARPSTESSSRSPRRTIRAAARSTTACSPQQQPQRATKTARFRFRVRRQAPYDTTAPP